MTKICKNLETKTFKFLLRGTVNIFEPYFLGFFRIPSTNPTMAGDTERPNSNFGVINKYACVTI